MGGPNRERTRRTNKNKSRKNRLSSIIPDSDSGIDSSPDGTSFREVLATYATIVRLPNLFTAPPDVIVGAALATGAGYTTASDSVLLIGGLAIASMLLYAAGTTLNDYFDAAEDARERPERPIPAGDISPTVVLTTGVALLFGGVVIAFAVAGLTAGVIAGGLAFAILLYDGLLKGTVGGFLCMGSARGLNILLGMAVTAPTTGVSPLALPMWALAIPIVILVYIAGVTYMAEHETSRGNARERPARAPVAIAIGGGVGAVLGVFVLASVRSSTAALSLGELIAGTLLLAMFIVWIGRPLRRAYVKPAPETIGPAVGACITGLIALNGAIAALIGLGWAVSVLVFSIPTIGLSRIFDIT